MNRKLQIAILACAFLLILQGSVQAEPKMVDRVVAVVGDQIILLSEVQHQIEAQMMERKLDLNSSPQALAALQQEVVDAMVNEELLQVKAERDSMIADPKDIDSFAKNEYARIRKQFPDDVSFQKALDDVGLNEQQLRYMYTHMAKKNVVQQMMLQKIEQGVSVSPQELETWYAANKDSLRQVPEQFRFSHIMMSPKVSDERKKVARDKLESIRVELKNGADFAELANKYSEIPGGTKDGGDLGYFRKGEFDEQFTTAAFALKKDEISDVVETSLGMHIIKVEDIRGDQVKARHIVILLKPDETDENDLVKRMNGLRDDIVAGKVKFEDLAKQLSEDESTKEFGGKTQLISVDNPNIPASFIQQASSMKVGDISFPFKSEYKAYHIMRLEEHREAHIINIKDDRSTLESLVKQRKIIKEFERIFAELRKETYIDIRAE